MNIFFTINAIALPLRRLRLRWAKPNRKPFFPKFQDDPNTIVSYGSALHSMKSLRSNQEDF